jgi:hypothetical protein
MYDFAKASAWTRFWHAPVRAERLAITRIFFGMTLLADQLFQYLQHFADFFGPGGVGFEGLHDEFMASRWHWTILFFQTDNLNVVYAVFWVWMAATLAFTLGWQTRLMNILVWLGTMCFITRNPNLKNGGDDVLQVGLFLLMLSPCGKALSLDRLLARRRRRARSLPDDPAFDPPMTPAWPVRLIQIQLCVLYLTTGLAKLARALPVGKDDDFFTALGKLVGAEPLGPDEKWGTWWQGTSIWYVLHDCTMARRAFAEFPIPFWITAVATYMSVWFETLFPLLMLSRWTRKWTLWFGVLFHIGIWLAIEVGWFSFYTICMYGVWIPDRFWERWLGKRQRLPGRESRQGQGAGTPEPAPAGV